MEPTKRLPLTQSNDRGRRVGLARALSKLGYCSRAQAFAMIGEGKVRLNGGVSRNPETPVRLGIDRIAVAGQRIAAAEKIYLMLNKPRGIVTTASDERGRDTVYSLLPHGMPWIAPVGRLDKASEGLLLLTNDSAWAARISDPATHLAKTYHVQIGARASDEMPMKLTRGIATEKGELLRAKSADTLRAGEKNCWMEIVLEEGKNRQIRRMFHGLGIEVLRLIRVSIGSIELGDLAKGACRALRPEEKSQLDREMRTAGS